MNAGWEARLACPRCGAALARAGEGYRCTGCSEAFSRSGECLVLRLGAQSEEQETQIAFYDTHEDWQHEVDRPWDRPRFHAWQLQEKARLAMEPIAGLLGPSSTVLVSCGGAGLDAELLARRGCDVLTTDISLGATQRALARAHARKVDYAAVVADAERLPLADGTVDVSYVHDGLHHLPDPVVGARELFRVARCAVAITEPAPSPATALAIRLRVAEHVEEAGNVVQRVAPDGLGALAVEHGFEVVRSRRYGMFYRDGQGRVTRLASARPIFPLACTGARAGMRVTGAVGNKLVFVAVRRGAVS